MIDPSDVELAAMRSASRPSARRRARSASPSRSGTTPKPRRCGDRRHRHLLHGGDGRAPRGHKFPPVRGMPPTPDPWHRCRQSVRGSGGRPAVGRTEGEEAMMDFNSSSSISGQVTAWSTPGCSRPAPASPSASTSGPRVSGVACERALQFEYAKAPIDHGRDIPGRMLRIFERGHVMEDCMVAWLRDAGFDLRTRKADGEQFGFSVADGRLQGHIDGVIVGGPRASPIPRSGNASASATSPGAIWRKRAGHRQAHLRRASGDLPSLSRTARAPGDLHGAQRRHDGDLHRARAL
jgi:hypothetical protein